MIIAGLAMAFMINCCDGGCGVTKEIPVENPTEAVVEIVETQPWIEPTTQAYIPEAPRSEGFVAYSIYGITPPIEWQRYLYDKLASKGFAWYQPYAICQIFLESRWNQWSDNGRDFGLTQQKGIYWEARAAHWGIPGANIWDPYAQLHVYSCMMCQYLSASGGDVGWAMSAYYLGAWDYSDFYVSKVMEGWDHLEVVR